MSLVAVPPFVVPAPFGMFEVPAMPSQLSQNFGGVGNPNRLAWVLSAPKAGNIHKVLMRIDAVAIAQDIDARIETVGTDGKPTGTLWATNTKGTLPAASQADNTSYWVALTADAAVARGDVFAIVLQYPGTEGEHNIYQRAISTPCSRHPASHTYTSGVWSAGLTFSLPVTAIEYSDASRPFCGTMPVHFINNLTFNSGSTPDEIGIRFTPPVPMRTSGLAAQIGSPAANSCTFKLYDAADALIASRSFDLDLATTSKTVVWLPWDSDVTLQAGQLYRMTVLPGSATNVLLGEWWVSETATLEALSMGVNWYRTERTDAGAWTDTNTKRPCIGLVIDGLDDGAAAVGRGTMRGIA